MRCSPSTRSRSAKGSRPLRLGKAIEAAKISELLQQVDTAQRNLKTIERDKVGPVTYDATQKDLWELKVALEDLLRRSPVLPEEALGIKHYEACGM
jgi:hypothetical protein